MYQRQPDRRPEPKQPALRRRDAPEPEAAGGPEFGPRAGQRLLALQARFGNRYVQRAVDASRNAEQQDVVRPNRTGLPDEVKSGVEALSDLSLDDVRVHYNSAKPAELGALAYTQGTEIHVAPGQEQHLPHEAWHVVQQKEGRVQPDTWLRGMGINQDAGLEREAGRMGEAARERDTRGSARTPRTEMGAVAGPGVAQLEIGETIKSVAATLGVAGTLAAIAAYFALPQMVVYGLLLAGGAASVIIGKLQTQQAAPSGGGQKRRSRKKGQRKKAAATGEGPAAAPARGPALAPTLDADEEEEETDDEDEAEDEEESLLRLAAIHSPKKGAAKPKPAKSTWTPPTPAEEWASAQRELGVKCSTVVPQLNTASRTPSQRGDHEVNQQSVLDLLPDLDPGHFWMQGRPDPTNDEVRVFVEFLPGDRLGDKTVIAKGISHDSSRRAGKFWVYEQVASNLFEHFTGRRHPKDPN